MAKESGKASGSRVSNIMGILRGRFDFKKETAVAPKPVSYKGKELISTKQRTEILAGSLRVVDPNVGKHTSAGSLMNLVQTSYSQVGSDRLENRKILQLMPEVDKAARLMVASIFSPSDLSRHEIDVVFDCDGATEPLLKKLNETATSFFQTKLNLKTSAPSWVYQFGYETGSAVFAIIPLSSFKKIQDESYMGTEAFVEKVIKPLTFDSLFGFGDTKSYDQSVNSEVAALESIATTAWEQEIALVDNNKSGAKIPQTAMQDFIAKIIGQEALSLTDNPAIMQAKSHSRDRRNKRTKDLLNKKFKMPSQEQIVSVSAGREDENGNDAVVGNPILMRLPPESVTVIHTPGDPSDHQGYLVMLDTSGTPITAIMQEQTTGPGTGNISANQSSIFDQTYNAYGLGGNDRGSGNTEAMNRIYTQVVSQHIKRRLDKAGFSDVELGNLDSVYRCMFGRFMQQKQTRILFLPKELVTYMAFELDPFGYGISRLERIKFNLGMKMAVQVSRVLATIKAAMDRRKIEIKFTDNLNENPEAIFQSVIQQYIAKSSMSFSIDPGVIQNQIADKSISIKGTDIPGMETFDIINEPDQRSSVLDFDKDMLDYLDTATNNGMHIPAATMNSLGENEYARSVATTNLFFSMDVSIDQDVCIKHISDLLRKYGRYSEDFRNEILKLIPQLKEGKVKKNDGKSSTDDVGPDLAGKKGKDGDDQFVLGDDVTLDSLIDSMLISLPKPNVAPDKAQFEALDSMVSSITATVTALFPDDMAGTDDSLRPVIAMLRAKLISANIRSYLNSSGMAGLTVPEDDFSADLKGIAELSDALHNIKAMMEDKVKINTPAVDAAVDESTPMPPVPGY